MTTSRQAKKATSAPPESVKQTEAQLGRQRYLRTVRREREREKEKEREREREAQASPAIISHREGVESVSASHIHSLTRTPLGAAGRARGGGGKVGPGVQTPLPPGARGGRAVPTTLGRTQPVGTSGAGVGSSRVVNLTASRRRPRPASAMAHTPGRERGRESGAGVGGTVGRRPARAQSQTRRRGAAAASNLSSSRVIGGWDSPTPTPARGGRVGTGRGTARADQWGTTPTVPRPRVSSTVTPSVTGGMDRERVGTRRVMATPVGWVSPGASPASLLSPSLSPGVCMSECRPTPLTVSLTVPDTDTEGVPASTAHLQVVGKGGRDAPTLPLSLSKEESALCAKVSRLTLYGEADWGGGGDTSTQPVYVPRLVRQVHGERERERQAEREAAIPVEGHLASPHPTLRLQALAAGMSARSLSLGCDVLKALDADMGAGADHPPSLSDSLSALSAVKAEAGGARVWGRVHE
ncbi:hypothetical protein KIPB_009032 [Kipferlia bialata]|uniref:Uncharacterized protein n=1 Tax=Kipferlia bialata TaxID=797122 RepID=A0A9K3D2K7_9EUKA|nr:hypothetical protein KIPB_009032 [Kipferlia bialata]|eukprot:g9032.t1